MNNNSIKDDELEKVNGGTGNETNELRSVFQTVDTNKIKFILSQHGIEAYLYEDSLENRYVMKETGEELIHRQLINLIMKNHWY